VKAYFVIVVYTCVIACGSIGDIVDDELLGLLWLGVGLNHLDCCIY
jgi:hypothetical protein